MLYHVTLHCLEKIIFPISDFCIQLQLAETPISGQNLYHVVKAWTKLNQQGLGPDIERDLSKLLELILNLGKVDMPESERYGALREQMKHEDWPQLLNIVGIVSCSCKFSMTVIVTVH